MHFLAPTSPKILYVALKFTIFNFNPWSWITISMSFLLSQEEGRRRKKED
jgi:hypothetical protein